MEFEGPHPHQQQRRSIVAIHIIEIKIFWLFHILLWSLGLRYTIQVGQLIDKVEPSLPQSGPEQS
jgi:hypothetical protein